MTANTLNTAAKSQFSLASAEDGTLPLRAATPAAWLQAVMADFDSFLKDHAAAEKKASGMAISMLSHYPDKVQLVSAMAELAVEELTHYREVVKWVHRRGLYTEADRKDAYVGDLRRHMRKGREPFLLDRLLVAGVIEARGAERFALVARALDRSPLQRFYQSIARSERRHFELFLELAHVYFDAPEVEERWSELLDIEAAVMLAQPAHAALH